VRQAWPGQLDHFDPVGDLMFKRDSPSEKLLSRFRDRIVDGSWGDVGLKSPVAKL
jgi:hypothetical protein